MAVPFQTFWHTAPFVDPLTHVHRVGTASDWWQHPELSALAAAAAAAAAAGGGALPGATPLIDTGSHALGRLPGASIADRVLSWRAMQAVVAQYPNMLQYRMVRAGPGVRACGHATGQRL